jgi:hypothetical protein
MKKDNINIVCRNKKYDVAKLHSHIHKYSSDKSQLYSNLPLISIEYVQDEIKPEHKENFIKVNP